MHSCIVHCYFRVADIACIVQWQGRMNRIFFLSVMLPLISQWVIAWVEGCDDSKKLFPGPQTREFFPEWARKWRYVSILRRVSRYFAYFCRFVVGNALRPARFLIFYGSLVCHVSICHWYTVAQSPARLVTGHVWGASPFEFRWNSPNYSRVRGAHIMIALTIDNIRANTAGTVISTYFSA